MKLIQSLIWQKRTWVYLCFGTTLVLSGIVLIGWIAGISSMVQIDENSVPMQFNTALSLFGIALAGMALCRKNYRVSATISALTLLLAALTLAQYVLDINLFIDELFMTHEITTYTSSPGRMAPNSALCFLLASVSLLVMNNKSIHSSAVTIIAGSISLIVVLSQLSILGYIFSIETSYGWGNMTHMSLQTAVGFWFFSVGLLLHIAFFRQAKNASVYHVPVILGSVFLMMTLLFTSAINNKNSQNQDPIHSLKQDLAKDHISLSWNNELLRLAANAPKIIQSTSLATEPYSLPNAYMALYLENSNQQTALVFKRAAAATEQLNLTGYTFHPAPSNPTAVALGVKTTELISVKDRQTLLIRLPLGSLFATKEDIAAILVQVDIFLFLEETLSTVLSEQDKLIFTSGMPQAAINLPFHTDNHALSIQFGVSEFSQSQNNIVYLIFCFGLFITLALVAITFVAQRAVNQTRQLLQHANDRETHESELSQSHLTLKLATDVAQLGTWRWDVETGELTWNEKMFEIYETPLEVIKSGLLFDYWYQTVHPEDRDQAANSLQEAVKNNQKWEREFRLALPNGVIKYIKATAICFINHAGQSKIVFGGNLDITQERELQYKLQEKTKQAEKDSLAKSQFLASMSHELRTPMNGVLGLGALLKNTSLSAKQSQYLDIMLSSAEKLLSLLNDILDLSKIEAGGMRLELLCVPFEEVVADCLKVLANSAHSKGLDYHYYKAQSVPDWVFTDPVRLEQIIINIVSNAIKFTEKGEVCVNIDIGTGKPSKHDVVMVTFEVCDTGIGLTAEQIKTIFLPFTQADQSTTRRYGGTGLGLSIVKQLIDMLEGNIEVESEPGKGTCVRFSIPMKLCMPQKTDCDSNPDFHFYQQHASVALDAVNCLVVDSNEHNRKWLDEMLHSWHCNVTPCADAQAGLQAWQKSVDSKRLFDALIIDRQVEGLDAFEFIRSIQKLSQEKGIKHPATVFVMTSQIVEKDIATCTELNIHQQLVKPIKQSEVFNALMTALGKKQTANVKQHAISVVDKKLSLKVLVAEDHPVNQMLVKEVLQNRGHQCHIVENGRLAVDSLASEHFDAVLMDVQMPIMDGITATKLIRKGQHQANICIIGLTAKALKGDKNICLDAGMNYYMTKPINPKLLLEALESEQIRSGAHDDLDSYKLHSALPDVELINYQILDRERSLITTGNDTGLLRKILLLTKENIGPNLAEIKALNSQQNWLQLSRAVHKCKGMLANSCTEDFIDLMEQLIDQAELEDEQTIQPLVKVVIQQIEKFDTELTDFLEKSI